MKAETGIVLPQKGNRKPAAAKTACREALSPVVYRVRPPDITPEVGYLQRRTNVGLSDIVKDSHYVTYAELCKSDMILRDFLAIDRTVLANQNTFLAYLRTALTLFVAGLTFVRFFDHSVVEIIGWIFVPLGVGTFAVGLIRYNRLRRVLKMIQTPPPGSGSSTSQ